MPRTLDSPRHEALVAFIIAQRKAKKLTQTQVAKRLKRYQSYITNIETGQRRVDVVELMALADAIGFDAASAVGHLYKIPKK
jgi:transcriptional regulator with XRE-family HTH domain